MVHQVVWTNRSCSGFAKSGISVSEGRSQGYGMHRSTLITGFVDQRCRFLEDGQGWRKVGEEDREIHRIIGYRCNNAAIGKYFLLIISMSTALLIKLGVGKIVLYFTVYGNLFFLLLRFVTDEIPLGVCKWFIYEPRVSASVLRNCDICAPELI